MTISRPFSSLLRAAVAAAALAATLPAAAAAAPADSLSGVVRDSAGKPLDAATVTIAELNRSATTGADGAFIFREIAPGRYNVIAQAARLRHGERRGDASRRRRRSCSRCTLSPLRLAPVTVTAARQPSLSLTSPLPIDEVGPEKLRRDESVSLAHALDGLAGVRDVTTGQQVGAPVVRGLWGPNVLVLDGGLRLEDYSWSTEDGPSVDPRMAENVEVIRGPASVLYGSNAIGGVVNVIPTAVPDALGRESFTHVGGEIYGATNNSEYGAIVRLEGANKGFGWQATGIGRTAGNFHTPTGNPETPTGDIYDTGYDALNGDIALGLKGESSSGTVRYEHYGGNFGMLDGPPVPDDNTGGPLRKLKDDRVQLGGNFLVGDSRLEVKAQWQRHWLEEVVGDSRAGLAPPPIELLLTTTSADVLLHHTRGDWLKGTVGVSGMYQTNLTSGEDPLIPNATTTTGGAFVFEQATKGQWSLLAGLRGDYGKINADSNADLALSAQTRNGSAFSGDIGAVYRPVPQLALSVNVGRAFSYPTMPELFSNGPLPAEGIYTVGLPTAVPQNSLDFDASVRWVTPQLTAAVSFYRNQINDYLFLDPTGNTATVPNDAGGLDTLDVWQYTQTSHATLSGVDVSVEWAAMRMITLRGRYDMVSGTNDANGEPLPLMPPPRGDLSIEWHTIVGAAGVRQLRHAHRGAADAAEPDRAHRLGDGGVHALRARRRDLAAVRLTHAAAGPPRHEPLRHGVQRLPEPLQDVRLRSRAQLHLPSVRADVSRQGAGHRAQRPAFGQSEAAHRPLEQVDVLVELHVVRVTGRGDVVHAPSHIR